MRKHTLKNFWFAMLLACSFCANSQEKNKRFSISISPAFLTDHIVIQPGFQYSFNSWALLAEVTSLSPEKMGFDGGHWIRTQAEVKKFFSDRSDKWYVSMQTAYNFRQFTDNDSGFYFTQHIIDTGATYSSAVIHSPVLSFAPKIGIEGSLGKAVFVDAFIGFGVRILFNRYDARDVTPTTAFHKREWGPDAARLYNQTVTSFHLPMGLRLGVRF
jgi:hypothetical protein